MHIKKNTIIIVFLALTLNLTLVAQEKVKAIEDYPIWIDMMEQSSVNMEDARKAFDAYWKHNTHFKGDRSKQFERWYVINSKRLDAYGNVISAEQVRQEFQRMRSFGNFEQKGKWYNYGPITVGPRNGIKKDGGRVKDIAFHPTDENTYLVSCFKSGLFKTTDAGLTWTPLTDQLPQEVYISKILPSNPSTIFIGTNSGVLKSIDGGNTWSNTSLASTKTNALIIKPNEENVLIAGTQSGIYRSTNEGSTWTQVQSASNVEELRVHPTNSSIMYAGTNGSTSQFFRSTDGGATWAEDTSFGQGAFMKIAVTPAEPNYVYVINSRDHLNQDSFEGVYRSTDSGLTFTKQSGETPCITGYDNSGAISRGQPNYNLFIVSDPNNANIVYAGGVKSWKSINGGISWTQVFNDVTSDGGGLHLDQLTWSYSPINDKLFAVNDGGIYFLNTNDKFQSITDGLPIAEVWECTQSQQNPTNVAGGTFHCGIKLNKDGVWLSPWGGDEATVLFDYSDDTYAYHFKYEKISRSVDGGLSFQRINSSSADRGFYTGTGVLDKSDVNTLFVGLFEVEKINNARTATSSQAWDKISSFGGNSRIEKIEQCDANHNIMYVSREGNNFYRSDNVRAASPNFTDLTSNLPASGKVTDIATHPTNENLVYILLGSQIYKSEDKGSSWTNISNGLPGVALLEMIYDKSSDEGIYVGTDIGIYYKDATLSSWIDYSDGLPVIRVSGMDIYYGATREESFLTVSTDGRGFWRSELNDITATAPTVGFSSNRTSIYQDGQIEFVNESTEISVGSFLWTFEGGSPATSVERNPIVTYNTIGNYDVTLTYFTNAGTTTKSTPNYITVEAPVVPTADFSVNNQTVFQGNALEFIDTSLGDPTSWLWTFEGGTPSTSTEQNPIITYNTLGNYKVTLEATNLAGTNTKEVVDYITVTENTGSGPLQAQYNFQGNLIDDSSYSRNLIVEGGFTPSYIADNNSNLNSAYQAPNESNKYLTNNYKGIGVNGERTVTAWIKTNNAGTRKTIVSWGQNSPGQMFNVMIENGNIRVEGGGCNVQNDDSTVARLDDDTWRHIAVTYNPSDGDRAKDIKLYIDGVYYANQPDSGDSFNSEATVINTDITTNNIQIGNANYNAGYYWRGALDDVRIYSVALTAEEVVTVMNETPDMPPVANFVASDTNIFSGDDVDFNDTSIGNPTSWSWVFEGGTPTTSILKNPTVNYSTIGTYKVTLTATNAFGADTKEIVDYISVTQRPAPTANFSANNLEIFEGDSVNFTDTSADDPTSWLWAFEGGTPTSSTEQNPVITYNTEGTYKVTLTASNTIGDDTKEEVNYITVYKPLGLPIDNYTIQITGETCRNSNNGIIDITVKEDYDYTATITGSNISEITQAFSVSNPLHIENLPAVTYQVCITITGVTYYNKCFTVVVSQPEDLSVLSKVNTKSKTVSLTLFGASSYTIELNDKKYFTSKNEITLDLESNKNNTLKVSTDLNCQGVFEENIMLNDTIFYPNPVSNKLTISTRKLFEKADTILLTIFSVNGKQVLSKEYKTPSNGKIRVNTEPLQKGIYIVSLISNEDVVNCKIIKQ